MSSSRSLCCLQTSVWPNAFTSRSINVLFFDVIPPRRHLTLTPSLPRFVLNDTSFVILFFLPLLLAPVSLFLRCLNQSIAWNEVFDVLVFHLSCDCGSFVTCMCRWWHACVVGDMHVQARNAGIELNTSSSRDLAHSLENASIPGAPPYVNTLLRIMVFHALSLSLFLSLSLSLSMFLSLSLSFIHHVSM